MKEDTCYASGTIMSSRSGEYSGRKWCSSSHMISRQTSKLGEEYSALRDIEISTGWSEEAMPKAAALPRST